MLKIKFLAIVVEKLYPEQVDRHSDKNTLTDRFV